mmetsp:Transcript_52410/g.92448  ORF Transcript_52410/g.92448 Transcript_52410/m.92448 type:complete len:86 (-) Transcript_52410:32-289(-)
MRSNNAARPQEHAFSQTRWTALQVAVRPGAIDASKSVETPCNSIQSGNCICHVIFLYPRLLETSDFQKLFAASVPGTLELHCSHL